MKIKSNNLNYSFFLQPPSFYYFLLQRYEKIRITVAELDIAIYPIIIIIINIIHEVTISINLTFKIDPNIKNGYSFDFFISLPSS